MLLILNNKICFLETMTIHFEKLKFLISGCGGDIEVIHALEMERSQHTGLPVRVTNVVVFGSNDVVRLIQPIEGTEDVIVNGDYHVSIVQSVELFESSTVSKSRILKLPGKIVAVNAEKHSNTEVRDR